MTPRILDKVTMIDDRWIAIPFIRDEHGDRPAIPFEAIIPARPLSEIDINRKDQVRAQDHSRR